ncbi:transcriptional regulator with XRE-family HTH domain [Saccharomonospora amisosensis]|uniref:Transcriptional regulator with XRE-family HTH domain n=1 Tax=Saccharomonospora amisosensis TaxID=1128677 RepID=A0A7X5UNN6_9PSEU|nr:helix-turn-helix transcriptional regulator [Saccharomonospora amisosensis]NIJ11340.1 transcriptional regulator with XRE-family HTH domain [Saccharomonospora amisosensis]
MTPLVEVSHVVAEWAFTQGLKKLRETSPNPNQSEIARRIGKSRATIGHYEMGRYLPSHRSIDIMLEAYGHSERAAYYRGLRDRVESRSPNWWDGEFPDGFPPHWLALFVGFESSAVHILAYDTQCVPELAQTQAYAEAVLRARQPAASEHDIEVWLRLLRGRQAVLDRTDPPRLRWLVDEAALRRRVGGAAVLHAQLDQLAQLAGRPNVELRVLTQSCGAAAATTGGFTELVLPNDVIEDLHDVVYVSTPVDRIHYESAEHLTTFQASWARLWKEALPGHDSVAFVEELAKELTGEPGASTPAPAIE